MGPGRVLWTVVAGILLPLLTIGVELTTSLCARHLFDPLPTAAHIVLAFSVPAGNLLVLRAREHCDPPPWLHILHGFALVVAAFYTVLFLPVLPLAVIFLVAGIGLFPLTPLFSLVATANLARRTPWARGPRWPFAPSPRASGVLFGVALVLVAEGPAVVTRVALGYAVSPDPAQSQRGLQWLRRAGSERALLRLCYPHSGREDLATLFLSGGADLAQTRQVYYRVTGVPFNAVSPPAPARPTLWDVDTERGGEAVGGTVDRLGLDSSAMVATVDPAGAVAYVEWTLELRNDTDTAQEARAHVQLPPDGVVSRLTLWISGEEREAAFGGTGMVRQAYERVVQVRRDPVLVTSAGPDRVMVQCFPVPPHGTLKTRLGVSVPLRMETLARGSLLLPHLADRNFAVAPGPLHSVWVESADVLGPGGSLVPVEPERQNVHAVRGVVSDRELSAVQIGVTRPLLVAVAAVDSVSAEPGRVVQTLRAEPTAPPRRIVLVVDGSRALRGMATELADALVATPPGAEVLAIVAADELQLSADAPGPAATSVPRVRALLQRARFRGGADNVPALVRAWEVAAGVPDGVIVWVHGPQPVVLESVGTLRQCWGRHEQEPRLLAIAVHPGPNQVLEALNGVAAVRSLPAPSGAATALGQLLASWTAGTRIVAERVRVADQGATPVPGSPGSPHVVKLWARDRALALRDGTADGTAAATALAVRYRLVTPLTGAVVLETAQEYRAAGLREPTQVPAVPEPAMWLLLTVASVALFVMAARRPGRGRSGLTRAAPRP